MNDPSDSDSRNHDSGDLGEGAFANDSVIDTEAEVLCPYCGETSTVALDPGSGVAQDYVEDCHVCCRPWRVRVHYDGSGTAQVWVEQAE